MNTRTKIAACAVGALALTGCKNTTAGTASVNDDAKQASVQLDRYQATQPVPQFDWSQLRQNLIEINTAQAETTQTTSFFFNLGTDAPVSSCPSIGFPIASTAQLTNPEQAIDPFRGDNGGVTVPQIEQTGVYTGDSSGTYVICVDPAGTPYAFYWEGYVATVTGPAIFADGEITLTGAPTFDFSDGES
jgi:hypothetical protein